MDDVGHSVLQLAKFDELITPQTKGLQQRLIGEQPRRESDWGINLLTVHTYQGFTAGKCR
jgi:hypothetical protein